MSRTHHCGNELWTRTTKVCNYCLNTTKHLLVHSSPQIHELQRTLPFSSDTQLVKLVKHCLQVNYKDRPSAVDAQTYLTYQ